MTLNDRERFILHTMSVMVVDSMIKKFKNDELEDIEEITPMSAENMIDTMNKIRDGRCRKLSKVDVSELYEEICEEMLYGSAVHKDNI
jgi:hypothetical protein